MKKNQDAFGRGLMDRHQGRKTHMVMERDDGFISGDDDLTQYFAPPARWRPIDRRALRFARGRVLDVGAGAGRHALALQERGFDVVAIDHSPLAVEVMKARGVTDARVMSVTAIPRSLGPFDTIVMMGNNMGLLGGERRARWLLRRFRGLTSPTGRIIGQAADSSGTENPDHLRYHRMNRDRGRLPGQLRLRARYGRLTSPWFDYLFLSRPELERILDGTGWRIARAFEALPIYSVVLEKT